MIFTIDMSIFLKENNKFEKFLLNGNKAQLNTVGFCLYNLKIEISTLK